MIAILWALSANAFACPTSHDGVTELEVALAPDCLRITQGMFKVHFDSECDAELIVSEFDCGDACLADAVLPAHENLELVLPTPDDYEHVEHSFSVIREETLAATLIVTLEGVSHYGCGAMGDSGIVADEPVGCATAPAPSGVGVFLALGLVLRTRRRSASARTRRLSSSCPSSHPGTNRDRPGRAR